MEHSQLSDETSEPSKAVVKKTERPKRKKAEHEALVEQRMEKYLENRHKTAVAAIEFENFISQLPDPKNRNDGIAQRHLVEKSFEHVMQHLDPYVRENLKEHLRSYLDAFLTVVRTERSEIRKAEDDRMSAEVGLRAFVDKLFKSRVGRRPKGNVDYRREGALITLTFADPLDYASFRNGQDVLPGGESVAAGSFHSTIIYRMAIFTPDYSKATSSAIPIAIINGEQPDGVYVHERQHMINHQVFGLFKALEPRSEREWQPASDPYQNIKDEVLAYLREGRPAGPSLKNPLYGHLFDPFTKQNEDKVRHLIEKIDRLVEVGLMRHNRALLINHLIDIPLARIPAWLDALEQFYAYRQEERYEYLNKAGSLVDETGLPALEAIWREPEVNKVPGYNDLSVATMYLIRLTQDAARDLISDESVYREKLQWAFAEWKKCYDKILPLLRKAEEDERFFESPRISIRSMEVDRHKPAELLGLLPPGAAFPPPFNKREGELKTLEGAWHKAYAEARKAAYPPVNEADHTKKYALALSALERAAQAYLDFLDHKMQHGSALTPYLVSLYGERWGHSTTLDAFFRQTRDKLLVALSSLKQSEIDSWYEAMTKNEKQGTRLVGEKLSQYLRSKFGRIEKLHILKCSQSQDGVRITLAFYMNRNGSEAISFEIYLTASQKAINYSDEKW